MDVVRSGDVVLVIETEGNVSAKRSHLLDTANTKRFSVGRGSCLVSDIIGKPFGAILQLKDGKPSELNENPEFDDLDQVDGFDVQEVTQDNRNLVDNNSAQQLTAEQIRSMKSSGMEGEKIISALIANSATFKNKTEFSQRKYLKRKRAKFLSYFRLCRPSVFDLCNYYFEQKAKKICLLRPDSLSRMLFCSNVCGASGSGCALVVETSMGLVTAAIASAITPPLSQTTTTATATAMTTSDTKESGGFVVLHAHVEQSPRIDALRMAVLPAHSARSVCVVSLYSLLSDDQNGSEPAPEDTHNDNDNDNDNDKNANTTHENAGDVDDTTGNTNQDDANNTSTNKQPRAKKELPYTRVNRTQAVEMISRGVHALLIACEEDPTPIFQQLLPMLSPGRNFCLFCPTQQFLVQCYDWAHSSEIGACMTLTDTWTREFQVLPGRTRPMNSMSSSSGFILTGVRVATPIDPPPQLTATPRKPKRQRR